MAKGNRDDFMMDEIVDSVPERGQAKRRPSILLVGKCILRETGNAATLHRLRLHVESGGYECVMVDPEHPGDQQMTSSLRDLIKSRNVVSAVGLHLYRSASNLLTCKELDVPYICYFGGTDMNEGVKSPEKLQVMTEVAFAAHHLIAFTKDMKSIALGVWPSLKQDAIKIFPQAITVNPNKDFDIELYIRSSENRIQKRDLNSADSNRPVNIPEANLQTSLAAKENNNSYTYNEPCIENETDSSDRKPNGDGKLLKDGLEIPVSSTTISSCPTCTSFVSFGVGETLRQLPQDFHPLVVLIAGIRPVKDVLYVAESWSKWQQNRGGKGRLLIIGPVLDAHYAKAVKTRAASLNGVLIADKLEPSACQEVIRNATAYLNTSISEGMSAAILEAMALGTPVLARDIPGNSAVIDHGVNGLLFNSPDTFLKQLQRLLEESELSRTLTLKAKEYLHHNHCASVERRGFLKVLQESIRRGEDLMKEHS